MQRAYVLFCLPKKEPKKGPAKGLHPLCRMQHCGTAVHSDLKFSFSMLSWNREYIINSSGGLLYVSVFTFIIWGLRIGNTLLASCSHSNKFTPDTVSGWRSLSWFGAEGIFLLRSIIEKRSRCSDPARAGLPSGSGAILWTFKF